MDYQLADYSYKLPPALIAQTPLKPRDHSRLLLLDKQTGRIAHQHFYDLADQLNPGDVLVLNDSKVFPARLIGHKAETGGRLEIFLNHHQGGADWQCLVGGRAHPGQIVEFAPGFRARLVQDNNDGTWLVRFNRRGPAFWNFIERYGQTPLPPYIKRAKQRAADRRDYQTVFATDKKVGSVAAPTAGRHFTTRLLKKIEARGVKIVYITLHVGLGTFAPVKVSDIREHKMHRELAVVSASTLQTIRQAKKSGHRIIAVGTTSARTLESLALDKPGRQSFWTDIFIYPGYQFKVVDALVTNFHLPESTLLMLVSALAGKVNIDRAYRQAVARRYRFFSYGDAMLIY